MAAKWPGISDGRHTMNRVPIDTVIVSEEIPVTALRVGDEIHEVIEKKGKRVNYTTEVNSTRWTRRGTTLIVNGYSIYSRIATVRIVRKRRTREQQEALMAHAMMLGSRNAPGN